MDSRLSCAGGSLIAALVISVPILWIAAGFTPKPETDPKPAVVDSAGVLTKEQVAEIQTIRFPADTPVIVRTVRQIPRERIGDFATAAMEEEPQWQTLRPRGFLRRYFRHDAPASTGAYVLTSLEPLLLQIRFGSELRLRAYRDGLAAGPKYREQQRFAKEEAGAHIVKTVRRLAQDLQRAQRPSLLMKLLGVVREAYADIEDYLLPSGGPFSKTFLAIYVSTLGHLGGARSFGWFLLVNLFCFLIPLLLFKKVLIEMVLEPAASNRAFVIMLKLIAALAAAVFCLSAVTTMGLLSHGRIEDEMALSNLGLGFIGQIGFDAWTYSQPGGILIAFPVAILKFATDALEASGEGPNSVNLNLAFLIWAAVLYVLPMPIGIFMLLVLVGNLGMKIVKGATGETGLGQAEN